MKYLKKNIVAGLIVLLCLVFFLSEIINTKQLGHYSRVLIFPLLVLFYYTKKVEKKLLFGLFLVFFAIAELMLFFLLAHKLRFGLGENYSRIGTFFCVMAYFCLFIFIMYKLNLKKLFKRFKMHIIILLFFGGYLLYALDNMVKHHGLASMSVIDYTLATLYNLSIIAVLLIALLNYLYNSDSRKALLLFVSCLCIVFSELVQTAYFFMAREDLLNLVYTTLLSIGFCFMYIYIAYKGKNNANSVYGEIDPLEISSTSELN